jgi:hypothetical protein
VVVRGTADIGDLAMEIRALPLPFPQALTSSGEREEWTSVSPPLGQARSKTCSSLQFFSSDLSSSISRSLRHVCYVVLRCRARRSGWRRAV